MNRITKFRIWDGKRYYYPEATKEESNHYLQFGSEGFWLFDANGKMITATEVGGVCEEYIGRTKDGTEIYEGDVIENTEGKIGIVVRREYGFWHKLQDSNITIYTALTDSFILDKKIVGNIHEELNH